MTQLMICSTFKYLGADDVFGDGLTHLRVPVVTLYICVLCTLVCVLTSLYVFLGCETRPVRDNSVKVQAEVKSDFVNTANFI